MLRKAIRALVWLALVGAVAYTAAFEDRLAGLFAFLGLLVILFITIIWLPRAAHRAFKRGDYKRAESLYKLMQFTIFTEASRAAVQVSIAACALAVEDWERALARLDRLDVETLSDAARAAWLNNRAYALARGGQDAHAALDYCEQAIALRPDVAGFRHTRGVALLALGRVDEAISELDRLWRDLAGEAGDELPALEAERCYDLGRAWREKGELDYASEYFQRAHRASPGSRWAARAAEFVEPVAEPALAEFLDA